MRFAKCPCPAGAKQCIWGFEASCKRAPRHSCWFANCPVFFKLKKNPTFKHTQQRGKEICNNTAPPLTNRIKHLTSSGEVTVEEAHIQLLEDRVKTEKKQLDRRLLPFLCSCFFVPLLFKVCHECPSRAAPPAMGAKYGRASDY